MLACARVVVICLIGKGTLQGFAGHSLGGALSILAAYDIQTEFDLPLRQVQGFRSGSTGDKQSCTWLLAC